MQAELQVDHIWNQNQQSIETAYTTLFYNYFMLTGELEKECQVPPIGCIQSVFHNNETPLENRGKHAQTTSHSLLPPELQTNQHFHLR